MAPAVVADEEFTSPTADRTRISINLYSGNDRWTGAFVWPKHTIRTPRGLFVCCHCAAAGDDFPIVEELVGGPRAPALAARSA